LNCSVTFEVLVLMCSKHFLGCDTL